MDNRERPEPHKDADQFERLNADDEGVVETPQAGALIAANLAGVNAGISAMTSGAPSAGNLGGVSADQAAAVVSGDDDSDMAPMDLDALEQFGSKRRRTGDQGVSPEQRELESDELNG